METQDKSPMSAPDGLPSVSDSIKCLRKDIDRALNTTKNHLTSRECALAFTNLQRGKMWLGKLLGTVGSANPYVNSQDTSNKVIDAQSEHGDEDYYLNPEWDQTLKIKEMRNIVDTLIMRSKQFTTIHGVFGMQSFLALEEAKMWYGWELDRIRNAAESK